jgi:apolipoprotein N-acyltransferase
MIKLINNYILLIAAGLLLTFAFAPFNILILAPLAILALLITVKNCNSLFQGFTYGFTFGFSHYLTSLFWISNSLTHDVGDFKWLIPFCITLIPLVLGIFMGLTTMIASYFREKPIAFTLVLPSLFVLQEFARTHFVFPFPWNLLAYTLAEHKNFLQMAFWLGSYGCTFVIVLTAALIGLFRPSTVMAALLIMFVTPVVGKNIIKATPHNYYEGITLRIVQPNINFLHNYNSYFQNKILTDLIDFSNGANITFLNQDTSDDKKIIILPEGALPYVLNAAKHREPINHFLNSRLAVSIG